MTDSLARQMKKMIEEEYWVQSPVNPSGIAPSGGGIANL